MCFCNGAFLRNCTLTLREENRDKPIFHELGEMLFTHFGLSGPLVLSASAHLGDMNKSRYYMDIDLKPALSHEQLDSRILRDFGDFPNRDFQNSLGKLLRFKDNTTYNKRCGIDPEKRSIR